jgi:tetratricopeptide (TPR) repeat protein
MPVWVVGYFDREVAREMEERDAYLLLQRGRELLEDGHPAHAAVVLERARITAPRKGSVLETLGRAYYSYGCYGEAAVRFQEALEIDPTNDYAHYCLGLCYLKTKRKAEAAGHFKIAWSLRPREAYRIKAVRFGAEGTAGANHPTCAN